MVCSQCGACCKYIAVDINREINCVKALAQTKGKIVIPIAEYISDDHKRLNDYKGIKTIATANKNFMEIMNLHPELNRIIPRARNKYTLLIYTPCKMLGDNNRCMIWATRPDICNKDKRESGVRVFKFPECTDEEDV